MRQLALAIILILFLDGCAHRTEPKTAQETKSNQESKIHQESRDNPERKNNPDAYRISELAELTGVYKNAGPYEYYLSNVIWGNAFPNMDSAGHPAHAAVELIDISSTSNSLTAKAIQNGCIISVKTYVGGRDLDIDNGQVVIHRNLHLPSGVTQDVPASPGHDGITLGIETEQQNQSSSTPGRAMLFVLFAASENRDVRFERVAGKPKGYRACDNR